MYNKQDSIFWWTLDAYVKNNPKYKNLSLDEKINIEQGFRLAYYGLFQYQLYIGKELGIIEPAGVQEISNYIVDHHDILYKIIYKDDKKLSDEEKKLFQEMLETVIIPFINDCSFEKIRNLTLTNEVIYTFIMQLFFKNKYDINYKNMSSLTILEEKHHSVLYVFLLTLLIIDPTHQEGIGDNVKKIFTKERLEKAYAEGRMLNPHENDCISPLMDSVTNNEDLKTIFLNFNYDHWKNADLNIRFKSVFQLSKLTALLLKDELDTIDFSQVEEEIYSLVKFYLPIILSNEEEIQKLKDSNNRDETINQVLDATFLYPIATRDFNLKNISQYYEDNKKLNKIKFSNERLEVFIDGVLYSLSYLRLIKMAQNESQELANFFVSQKKVALVNSLKLFKEKEPDFFEAIDEQYDLDLNEIFINTNNLNDFLKQEKELKNKDDEIALNDKIIKMLKAISLLVSLDPKIVREMSYSLEEIVKYYLLCFGPYKKTKLGFDKADLKDLNHLIKKINHYFSKKENQEKYQDYYPVFYLINKLLTLSKKDYK